MSCPCPSSFDAVFTCALEHLEDPVQALREIAAKPEGIVGVVMTDWSEPLISPPDDALQYFFTLFERGFQHHGGSLQRGRHLRGMLHQAGLTALAVTAACSSASPALRQNVDVYIDWMETMPLFDQAIALGWIDRDALGDIQARMRQWSAHPDAFLPRCAVKQWAARHSGQGKKTPRSVA